MERTPYMSLLMTATQPGLLLEAVINGFDGSWERLIAKKLHQDYLNDHSEATLLVDSVKVPGEPASKSYLKAAHLITSSKKQEHV